MSKEVQPIFLFSLPRSGSTLLQRILAAHPEIATVSEPHLLLPFVYSLRKDGVYAEYGQEVVARGIADFCGELPGGEGDYREELESFVLNLYAKAAGGNVSYFLDKTPRYSLIVEEILDIFKGGKFLLLVRNPLAVISSIQETFKDGRWCSYAFNSDLYCGLPKLIEAYRRHRDRLHLVHYEKLIDNPVSQCRQLFAHLDLPFTGDEVAAFTSVEIKGLGDQAGMKSYRAISREPLDKWKVLLANPLRKAWCRRYLRWLGAERLQVIGYDLDELLDELDAIPFSSRMLASDSLRMPYGVLYRMLEPKLFLGKARLFPHWHKVHVHY